MYLWNKERAERARLEADSGRQHFIVEKQSRQQCNNEQDYPAIKRIQRHQGRTRTYTRKAPAHTKKDGPKDQLFIQVFFAWHTKAHTENGFMHQACILKTGN